MDRKTMQQMINSPDTPEKMLTIAKSYLNGSVLLDPIAAEGWLMKTIEANDPVHSPRAMALLAMKVLGQETILSDEDYLDIQQRSKLAKGREKQELMELLSLGTRTQKSLCE